MTAEINPFHKTQFWTLSIPKTAASERKFDIVAAPQRKVESMDQLTEEEGADLVTLMQDVHYLFKEYFKSEKEDNYFLHSPLPEEISQQKNFSLRFVPVNSKKTAPEDVKRLHNSLLKMKPVSVAETLTQKFKEILSKPREEKPFAEGKPNPIPSELQIGSLDNWTFVLQSRKVLDGHIVAVSQREYDSLADISKEQGKELVTMAKIAKNLFQNRFIVFLRNKKAAGQSRPSAHMHYVPLVINTTNQEFVDGLNRSNIPDELVKELIEKEPKKLSDEKFQEWLSRYRNEIALQEQFNVKLPEPANI